MDPHDDPCLASSLIDIEHLTDGPLWACLSRLYHRRFPAPDSAPAELCISTEIRLMPLPALPITQGNVHVTLYAEPEQKRRNRTPRDATVFFSRILSRSSSECSEIEGLCELLNERLPVMDAAYRQWRDLMDESDPRPQA